MIEPTRTSRIALRCTPNEQKKLEALARTYGLSLADFIRQAVIIAAAQSQTRRTWQLTYLTCSNFDAINNLNTQPPTAPTTR